MFMTYFFMIKNVNFPLFCCGTEIDHIIKGFLFAIIVTNWQMFVYL